MTDILIYGINGKMGREVYLAASADCEVNVCGGVDKKALGDFNCPVYRSLAEAGGQADCIIDFSSPSALGEILNFATDYRCALVLATTGYTDEDICKIKKAAEQIPILLTANASVGINALTKILPKLTQELKGADASITEYHRKNKKDRPSGTAKLLKGCIGECEINSIRGGDLPGIHEICFMMSGEMIKITHIALSRRVFAEGAVLSAKKLVNLPNGLYETSLNE